MQLVEKNESFWIFHSFFKLKNKLLCQSFNKKNLKPNCVLGIDKCHFSLSLSLEGPGSGTLFSIGYHYPSGSFIGWAHVTFLACKANAQSTNSSYLWIEIRHTNYKKDVYYGDIPQYLFVYI